MSISEYTLCELEIKEQWKKLMMLPKLDAFITQICIDVNCYQCGDVSSSMKVEVKKEMKHMYMCVQLQIRHPSNLLCIIMH